MDKLHWGEDGRGVDFRLAVEAAELGWARREKDPVREQSFTLKRYESREMGMWEIQGPSINTDFIGIRRNTNGAPPGLFDGITTDKSREIDNGWGGEVDLTYSNWWYLFFKNTRFPRHKVRQVSDLFHSATVSFQISMFLITCQRNPHPRSYQCVSAWPGPRDTLAAPLTERNFYWGHLLPLHWDYRWTYPIY